MAEARRALLQSDAQVLNSMQEISEDGRAEQHHPATCRRP